MWTQGDDPTTVLSDIDYFKKPRYERLHRAISRSIRTRPWCSPFSLLDPRMSLEVDILCQGRRSETLAVISCSQQELSKLAWKPQSNKSDYLAAKLFFQHNAADQHKIAFTGYNLGGQAIPCAAKYQFSNFSTCLFGMER